MQTCQVKSPASEVHDWSVYRLGVLLGSMGHRVKIHKITPTAGKERGDLEIKDHVVLQKPQEQVGQLTNTRSLDDALEIDGDLRVVVRKKILHYCQLYIDRPELIAFLPVTVETSDRVYDDFSRLFFLHDRRNRINFVFFVLFAMLILRGHWG